MSTKTLHKNPLQAVFTSIVNYLRQDHIKWQESELRYEREAEARMRRRGLPIAKMKDNVTSAQNIGTIPKNLLDRIDGNITIETVEFYVLSSTKPIIRDFIKSYPYVFFKMWKVRPNKREFMLAGIKEGGATDILQVRSIKDNGNWRDICTITTLKEFSVYMEKLKKEQAKLPRDVFNYMRRIKRVV